MKTYSKTLEEGLKEFDGGIGRRIMSLEESYCTEMGFDCDFADYHEMKSFLTSFAEKIRKGVVEEIKSELLKRMMKYNSKDGYSIIHDEIIEKVYNDVEDITKADLLAQLKDK